MNSGKPSALALSLAIVLDETRVARRMSKRRLAREVDVEPSYITHILAGRKTPSFEVFVRLSRALGAQPSRMLALAEGREVVAEVVGRVDDVRSTGASGG